MKLTLKRFSQDVDLESPEEIKYFLVFDAGDREVKLPVQKDTTEALINLIYSDEGNDVEVDPTDDGGDVRVVADEATGRREGLPASGTNGQNYQEQEEDEEETGPSSEEDVESL